MTSQLYSNSKLLFTLLKIPRYKWGSNWRPPVQKYRSLKIALLVMAMYFMIVYLPTLPTCWSYDDVRIIVGSVGTYSMAYALCYNSCIHTYLSVLKLLHLHQSAFCKMFLSVSTTRFLSCFSNVAGNVSNSTCSNMKLCI